MIDVERPARAEIATKKHLLAEGLFQLIGERIVSGDLAPGARIRDNELAAELSVSRTPVREALQRLERIGLVMMYPSRYTEVTSVTPEQVETAHVFAGLQAGIIARLACRRLSADEVEVVCGLIRAVPADLADAAATSRARHAVVGFLAARSGNTLQQSLVGEASLALSRALKTHEVPAERHPAVAAACADLEEALRLGDADAAEQACRRMYDVI
ncbi:GntR family transcriptional regulator [Microbacterium esteraromaticum]|uniref:GntR family transcriptional regulator n=1 Tax=Microbacterium esteraromaticum TaxID=57043 RepID=UPI00195E2749|nr:GntR family transcriptional regulator [Microbacterium esteraromaticum]MBM7465439.1 DNA-binding GntR family transcriptional regulator [Microbacterium esteraromaticum]